MPPTSVLLKILSCRTSFGNFDLVLAGPIKISKYILLISNCTEFVHKNRSKELLVNTVVQCVLNDASFLFSLELNASGRAFI